MHRLGFGAMRITGPGIWGPPADPDDAIAVLRRAVELGVDLIDTADSYGPTVSEELIFEALHPYGDVMVATKAGLLRTGPGRWHPCGRPEYLRQQCELSLRRLGVEAIDLFQLHRIDPTVDRRRAVRPAAALLATRARSRPSGSPRSPSTSSTAARKVVADRDGPEHLQRRRAPQRGAPRALRGSTGIGFIPYFPVAAGALAGPDSAVAHVARELGATPAQVSLGWLLQHSPVMLPIPGTSSVAHLEENCAAATLTLDDRQRAALDALAAS